MCAAAVSTGCSATAPVVAPEDLEAAIQAKTIEVCNEAKFPGMTVAIAMPDGRILTAAAGWSDQTRRVPLSASSRMLAGSVGKTFVAAAVLQAVDDGVLDLDSPIERWVGREPWFSRIPNASQLTLRLLLSHRSGIPEPFDNDAFVKAVTADLDKTWEPRELLPFVFDKAPESPAGTKYSYTDMNFVIAGIVFEHAVGRPLFAEIERRILEPLHLDETVPSERRDLRDVVPGLLDRENPFYPACAGGESMRDGRLAYNASAEYAGGGLISTSRDLARFAKALFEGRLFSQARLAEMLDAKPSEGDDEYGLGVIVSRSGAGPVYAHDGWTPGYLTQMVYFPDFGLAAAMQIDSDPMERYELELGEVLGQIVSIPIHTLSASIK